MADFRPKRVIPRQRPGLVPTFRSSCYVGAPTPTNFGKSWALANILILVALFLSEVPGSNSPRAVQELQIGGTRTTTNREHGDPARCAQRVRVDDAEL